MMIPNDDNTVTTGPLDVVLIYCHVDKGTFHPAFYEEDPMPGPSNPQAGIRLKSKMHHTTGFSTLEEAQENIRAELQPKLRMADSNVALDSAMAWDGSLGHKFFVPNWHDTEQTFSQVVAFGI